MDNVIPDGKFGGPCSRLGPTTVIMIRQCKTGDAAKKGVSGPPK
jgi:hypothetical protein